MQRRGPLTCSTDQHPGQKQMFQPRRRVRFGIGIVLRIRGFFGKVRPSSIGGPVQPAQSPIKTTRRNGQHDWPTAPVPQQFFVQSLGPQPSKQPFPQQIEILPQRRVLHPVHVKRRTRSRAIGATGFKQFGDFLVFFASFVQPVHGAHHLDQTGVHFPLAPPHGGKGAPGDRCRTLHPCVPGVVVFSFQSQQVPLGKGQGCFVAAFGTGGSVQGDAVDVLLGVGGRGGLINRIHLYCTSITASITAAATGREGGRRTPPELKATSAATS